MSLLLSVVTALAVQAAAPAPVAPAPRDTAVLRLGSRVVTVFRSPLGAASPSERATAASQRLQAALSAGADSVSTDTVPEGTLLRVGGRPAFIITSGDADTTADQTLDSAVAAAQQQLTVAIAEVRESRNLIKLLLSIGVALLATAVFVLVIRLLLLAQRRVPPRVQVLVTAAVPQIAFRGFTVLTRDQVRTTARLLTTGLIRGLALVAGYLYLTFLLTRFPWTRAWGEALGRFLATTAAELGLGALRALPSLFTVALIFLVTRFVAGLIRTAFNAVERGTLIVPGIHPETAQPTRRIVVALLWLFALVVAYPYLPGSGSDAFKGVSVFAGLLLTLGSAGLVGQAMSGLVVMYSRAFREGDFVQIGTIQGTVVALGMLSTRLRTPKQEYVTIPNGVLVSGTVTNYSAPRAHDHALTIYSSVTIGYDAPWRKVHDLMIQAAQATEGVLDTPAPFVLQRALTDWYVDYQVNAAIDPARAHELPAIYSRLHANIQDSFNKAGVEIMSPTYLAVRDGNRSTIPGSDGAEGAKGARPAPSA